MLNLMYGCLALKTDTYIDKRPVEPFKCVSNAIWAQIRPWYCIQPFLSLCTVRDLIGLFVLFNDKINAVLSCLLILFLKNKYVFWVNHWKKQQHFI